MKRVISIILVCTLFLSACGQAQQTNADGMALVADSMEQKSNVSSAETVEKISETSKTTADPSDTFMEDSLIADEEDADPTPYKYEVNFSNLDDEDLMRYVKDNIYAELVNELDSDKYFVENISTVYVSQEYIDELTFNSQPNVYFGYTLAELNEAFQGTRYVFTLGDEGETIITAFESYDDTYEKVLKNVAVGTGVILICITVSVVTGGTGTSAVSMIFAASAKTGTIFALSSGALSSVAAGVTTGIQTKDMEQAKKAAALAGSEEFKWGAIMGVVSGGTSEAITLKGATLNGLTMNEAAAIQKESKYPIGVIKKIHTTEEYKIYKDAKLKPCMINGQTALIRPDIDLNFVDNLGRTNLQRMKLGLSPIDVNGVSYELHHIGQEADATLAILTQAEHDNAILHGFKAISEINRKDFDSQRKNFWKTMANVMEEGKFGY